jgi:putative selenate reductase
VTCSKCVPVCPNAANFTFVLPATEQPVLKVSQVGGAWTARQDGTLAIAQKLQFANFADFCNECGNCDVFCPEDGGPYAIKPRFFGTAADWRHFASHDGYAMELTEGGRRLLGRIDGKEYAVSQVGAQVRFCGPGFDVTLAPDDPVATLAGHADGEIDLSRLQILRWVQAAVYDSAEINPVNALLPRAPGEAGAS